MNHLKTIGFLMLVFAVAIGGCGRDADFAEHEKLRQEWNGAMNELATILDTVNDDASTAAAKPKLEALLVKSQDIRNRRLKLRVLKSEELRDMKAKFEKEEQEVFVRYTESIARIVGVPRAEAQLYPVIEKILMEGQ